jgi:hypothetical protein
MSITRIHLSQYGTQRHNARDFIDLETARNYWTILLATAGAEGDLAPAELEWLINDQRSLGVPEELLAEIPKIDWRGANIQELLEKLRHGSVNARRNLLYQALRMARADGRYHKDERTAVEHLARTLDLEPSVVDSIHALVDMEEVVERLRYGLLEKDIP